MTEREAALEIALRRWAVHFRGDAFKCDECTGTWSLGAKRERHVRSCVLFSEGDDVAPPPPEIPF